MKPRIAAAALAVIVPAFLLAMPASAGQRGGGSSSGGSSGGSSNSGGSGGGGGHASGGGGGGGHASGGGGGHASGGGGHASGGGGSHASGGGSRASGGGYSGGSSTRGSAGSSGGSAVPRGSAGTTNAGSATGTNGATTRSADGSTRSPRTIDGTPEYSRPRDGRTPVGTAVPRGSVPPTLGGGGFIPAGYYGGIYDPGFFGDPYGFYGGYGYYGGYYDPWYGAYPAYGQVAVGGPSDEGALRLKIKPKEAEVYVDGFYVGIVDDFDGIFQRLHVETGPHRIEVRAPGYEPLTFDVRITEDHTTTYEGELKKIQ